MSVTLAADASSPRVQSLLSSPRAFGTVLHAIFLREFGVEAYQWEPETIEMEINETFSVKIPSPSMARLMAVIGATATDSFYRSWTNFSHTCSLLSGDMTPFSESDPVTAPEMAWGVVEVRLNDSSPSAFSPEVSAFVGRTLSHDGFFSAPAPLGFAEMPSRFMGAGVPGSEQAAFLDAERAQAIKHYIRDQGFLLSQQISLLPWMKDEDMEALRSMT